MRNSSTIPTLTARRRQSSNSQRADRVPSATSQHHLDQTDVVIPSNLLAALTAGPYITDTNQFEGNDAAEIPNYDVRQIAQHLQGETSRILARSASIAVAGLSREFAFGDAPEFRKTSLGPNFGSSIRNQPSPHQPDSTRHALSTVAEGKVAANEKCIPANDYFGDYVLGTQATRLHRRTSSGQSVTRKARVDEPSPTGPDEIKTVIRDPSNDIEVNRISIQRSRKSTVATSRRESIVQRSASVVFDTEENVKQAIRRSSIYHVYEMAKKRGAELQRSTWAMKSFEYTFHLILVAFVYFVLIGLPLWKGAVYWLYWVFEHKFAVAGTWYVVQPLVSF
jgi:hypothetical protein